MPGSSCLSASDSDIKGWKFKHTCIADRSDCSSCKPRRDCPGGHSELFAGGTQYRPFLHAPSFFRFHFRNMGCVCRKGTSPSQSCSHSRSSTPEIRKIPWLCLSSSVGDRQSRPCGVVGFNLGYNTNFIRDVCIQYSWSGFVGRTCDWLGLEVRNQANFMQSVVDNYYLLGENPKSERNPFRAISLSDTVVAK